ncbi:hypothetical protein [Pseudobutyrivibrio xylanivorans]|uniref:CDP-Glycerol:Poly(Glycerophosphate) glycerophosphotransferase n=1 Tax=Pseudobutyrivibrio xylanivorans TaxID=185007 RepID=A0A5P6VMS3_PSEXY|nr:hypothetical protein [Pseudobutyrivibrio xylanivorans]QFJ53966.1 hypothetical protein FXF36_03315 [Pseudobutyrivibrio xylanivorans]
MLSPTIENFLEFERKYKCNSIRIYDIPVWTLYRYEVHNTIKKYTIGKGEGSQTPFKKSELFAMALNALKPLPRKKVDVIFVADGRRNRNIDTGVYENIFFDEVSKKFNSILLEHPDNHTHLQPNGMDNVFFTDRVSFYTNIAVKLSTKFNTKKRQAYTKAVEENYGEIFKAIETTFGPDVYDELVEGFVDRMYYYEINKKFCGKILDRVQPKLIMELCYFSMESFAYSALGKERGIPTAEYAHGFSFPSWTPVQFNPEDNSEVLPDYHLVYSRTQEDVVHMPSNVKVLTVGFPFFERERAKYKAKYPKDDKTICFMSTEREGVEISKIAAAVADKIGDEYHIIYKLHPKEFSFYKEKYPWLLDKKVDIIDTLDNHIFRYLAESKVAISTVSASVWESIGFGCGSILLDIREVAKDMAFLIKEEGVTCVNDPDAIVDLIKNDKVTYVDPDSIFEPNAMANICNFIKEYI